MSTKTFASDEARKAKNERIRATRQATALKRQKQRCKVYHLKIVQNKLSQESKESLERAFLEAKWLRNAALATDWKTYDTKATKVLVKTPKGVEERTLENLGSQLRQSIVASIGRDASNLAKAKNAGRKIGKLRFVSSVSSIDLKQAGSTYRLQGKKVKVQGIKGWLRLRGVEQLEGKELANAKLLKKADGYYLAVTTYATPLEEKKIFKTDAIGLDFGVKTHITLSDGREYNFLVEENERVKRLQRKLSRQVKGSKNREKTLLLLGREHQKSVCKRDELANQFVHALMEEASEVFFQDDNLASWKSRKSFARGGKRLQGSILGRVKAKLLVHPRAVRVERFVATTATCKCGVKTPHGLGERWFVCGKCGYRAPRDVHAAQNMIRFGSPAERGAAPVEELSDSSEQVLVKQETVESRSPGADEAVWASARP